MIKVSKEFAPITIKIETEEDWSKLYEELIRLNEWRLFGYNNRGVRFPTVEDLIRKLQK